MARGPMRNMPALECGILAFAGTFYARSENMREGVSQGISFGAAMAICISWSLNHSILWAIVHGICGWFYVVYAAIWRL